MSAYDASTGGLPRLQQLAAKTTLTGAANQHDTLNMGAAGVAIEREISARKDQQIAELTAALAARDAAIAGLKARIAELEAVLREAADALQKCLPIGKVKAIGLLEVGAASGVLAKDLAAVTTERDSMREALKFVTTHKHDIHNCIHNPKDCRACVAQAALATKGEANGQ